MVVHVDDGIPCFLSSCGVFFLAEVRVVAHVDDGMSMMVERFFKFLKFIPCVFSSKYGVSVLDG